MNIGLTDGLVMFLLEKKVKYGIILNSALQCFDSETKILLEKENSGIEILKFLPISNVESLLKEKIQEIMNMPIGINENIMAQLQTIANENNILKERLNSLNTNTTAPSSTISKEENTTKMLEELMAIEKSK